MSEDVRLERVKEMRDITRADGNVVAYSRAGLGKLGLILKKTKDGYVGRELILDNLDCEYRIAQVRNARLGRAWKTKRPWMVGFLPADEVKQLLAGERVSRGCL